MNPNAENRSLTRNNCRVCRRRHIRKLSLFGSVLRDDFSPDSDIDILVEFEPGARIGLIGFATIEIELSELLERKVDLNTSEDLSDRFRQKVLDTTLTYYER
jgi:hypothetical protein